MTQEPRGLVAIVPAAGVGRRMQLDHPKQYLRIGDRTVLEHTLQRLLALPQVERAIVAISDGDPYFGELELAGDARVDRVAGGEERADSVLNGLKLAQQQGYQWALVHDAARPCVREADIQQLIDCVLASPERQGGLLAMPVRDTMKRAGSDRRVCRTEDRDNLWHALTPQLFPVDELLKAISLALSQGQAVTDEASAMELQGGQPLLVEGHGDNIKITRPADLPLAEFFLHYTETEGSAL